MKLSFFKLASLGLIALGILHSSELVAHKKSNPINDDGPICTKRCEQVPSNFLISKDFPKKPPINDDGGGNGKRG